jgi:hypothetical protein
MALDPARRRRNLPTGDIKPEFESPPGYQQYLLIVQTSNLMPDIEHAWFLRENSLVPYPITDAADIPACS